MSVSSFSISTNPLERIEDAESSELDPSRQSSIQGRFRGMRFFDIDFKILSDILMSIHLRIHLGSVAQSMERIIIS